MKKKLILLDLALAVAVCVLVIQVRDRWFEARKRSDTMFGQKLKQVPAPPYSPLAAVPQVAAATYSAVAMKFPFSADRNPTVVVEPPKEPPMPNLPVYYGLMTLPDGDTAIMAARSNEASHGIHFGEKVGEFTLVDVGEEDVTLEWNGKTVVKKISELRPRMETAKASAAAKPPDQPSRAQKPAGKVDASPWDEIGPNLRACRNGDESPTGTQKDGWKKIVTQTPMGSTCHWELGN